MTNKNFKISDIKPGDIFSEISHYVAGLITPGKIMFKHLESGETVELSNKYVEELLSTADQYDSEKTVTKEDKQNGEAGIRTIWENIHSSEVFTVCFRKQDTVLSESKQKLLKEEQLNEGLALIEQAQKSKKGVAAIAKEVLRKVQENPITVIEPGEMRVLRGYKTQYDSRDGKYNCVDMDLVESNGGDLSKAIRPVNINTIQWLVFKGVKYNVK